MGASATVTKEKKTGGSGLLRGDWQERLAFIVEAMRDMSEHSEPQEMVRSYGSRVRQLMPAVLAFAKPARTRVAAISDHAVKYLDRSG